MNPHDDDETLDITRLRDELHELERRVARLEHPVETALFPGLPAPAPPTSPDFALPVAVAATGRAVLGLAGAYLLRAAAESGAAPRLLMVVAGVLYAGVWLFFAVRARRANAVAGNIYSVTSALILAPLLWEATVRFAVLPTLATAGVLIAFGALSFAAPVIAPAATVTAIALMIRTGDLVPFVAALLIAAALVEADVSLGHRNFMRVPAVLAADFGIWVLIHIMGAPEGVPSTYKPVDPAVSVALCAGLFLVVAAGLLWRNVLQRSAVSWFEICQATVAFLLSAWGALLLTQGRGTAALGVLCFLCSVACYAIAFIRFPDLPRNHQVFASWGLALALATSILILPESAITPLWSAAAVVATLAGTRFAQPTVALHGTLCLFAAAMTSGIPRLVFNAFTGSTLEPAAPALAILAVAAVGCYFAWGRAQARLSVVAAVLAAGSIAALAILIASPSAALLAPTRTLAISALALVFAFSGSRTGRHELVWIGYSCIALGTVKLVFEDFQQSSAGALALSLVCYGGLLILLPRLSATATK